VVLLTDGRGVLAARRRPSSCVGISRSGRYKARNRSARDVQSIWFSRRGWSREWGLFSP